MITFWHIAPSLHAALLALLAPSWVLRERHKNFNTLHCHFSAVPLRRPRAIFTPVQDVCVRRVSGGSYRYAWQIICWRLPWALFPSRGVGKHQAADGRVSVSRASGRRAIKFQRKTKPTARIHDTVHTVCQRWLNRSRGKRGIDSVAV